MKKILTLIAIILTVWIIPITPNTATAADKPHIDKLRVTYVKLPLNVPTILVKHFGMLEKEFAKDHISIDWVEITEGGKQTQALAAGSIDIASVVSSTAAITARANGMALKIVSVFSRAPKAFALVALDPAIKTVADLKGKKVAGPKGSLLNQTLFAALLNSGLKLDDVGYVHMPVPKAFAALIGGSIDAALIAGPTVIRAEAQGARIIVTGEGLVKGLIVTAVAEPFIDGHADVVKQYLQVQGQALAFMKNNPDQTYAIVAQETGLSADDVKRMYPWYDFTPTVNASDMADLTATQQFLLESGMLNNPTDIQALVYKM
jgi:sulfonate transport system substrate-binding protein